MQSTEMSSERGVSHGGHHDQWLRALTGHASHVYTWGEIWSGFDPKSGSSSIVIQYSWQGKPWRRQARRVTGS
jgi:hypothetical protein